MKASSEHSYMTGKVFGATNDAGLIPHRESKRLGFVEFRIGEGGNAHNAIQKRLRELIFSDIETIGKNDIDSAGRNTLRLFRQGIHFPWIVHVFVSK